MTQTDAILSALLRGDRLTQLEAYDRFGCTRLPARVWDLRKAGHVVQERMVRVPTRYGTTEVAEYWMVPAGELFQVAASWE